MGNFKTINAPTECKQTTTHPHKCNNKCMRVITITNLIHDNTRS